VRGVHQLKGFLLNRSGLQLVGSGLGGSDGFSLVFGVELHEFGQIELRLL
jgi:hypothetical protein